MHIAIIPDGNRRYAKNQGIPLSKAHEIGADKMEQILEWIKDKDIKTTTIYALSKENLQRKEIDDLYKLIGERLNILMSRTKKENLGVNIIGDMDSWPEDIINMELLAPISKSSRQVNILIAPDSDEIEAPDLLIRTGGMCRLSGFSIGPHTTIYFTNTMFPGFTQEEFDYILHEFYPLQIQNFGR